VVRGCLTLQRSELSVRRQQVQAGTLRERESALAQAKAKAKAKEHSRPDYSAANQRLQMPCRAPGVVAEESR
jgi:hypothetical protein